MRRAHSLTITGLALLFSALPILAIAEQELRLRSGTELVLPVTVARASEHRWLPRLSVSSRLHELNLRELSGDSAFVPGDEVFVFLSQSADIWYPYAVLKARPQSRIGHAENTVMLRGTVLSAQGERLRIAYDFDHISPQREAVQDALRKSRSDIDLHLSIDANGRSALSAIAIDGETFPQRVNPLPVLRGLSKSGASTIPAK